MADRLFAGVYRVASQMVEHRYASALAAPAAGVRIVVKPGVAFGRPYIAGKGVTAEVIYDRIMGGESVSTVATDYALTNEQVREVFRFAAWCRRRGRYDAPYAERLARRHPEAGGWPRQVWPRRDDRG